MSASSSTTTTTISRCPGVLQLPYNGPFAVAIGPYHRRRTYLRMEPAKRAALEALCGPASQPQLEAAIREKIAYLAGDARRCYADDSALSRVSDSDFAEMMLLDGCFLLQFMASMCPDHPAAPLKADPLMSRAEVYTCVDLIAGDIMLLENQIPWFVLEALMQFRPRVREQVDSFLALMGSYFHVDSSPAQQALAGEPEQHDKPRPPHQPPPPHLLGLFYRRQVGAERTQRLPLPRLPSPSNTAVELAEMGIKLTANKSKKFGDMTMTKRRWPLGLYGELSLAPVVVNDLTACWLQNMTAHEMCLNTATRADNFVVSSYMSVVSLLLNRREDVQKLRAKGIVVTAYPEGPTLEFFTRQTNRLRVGDHYYRVFEQLQEYRRERWLWIAVHRFLYKNAKAIVAVLSVAGVLAGLFKAILSLKHPQAS